VRGEHCRLTKEKKRKGRRLSRFDGERKEGRGVRLGGQGGKSEGSLLGNTWRGERDPDSRKNRAMSICGEGADREAGGREFAPEERW